MLLLGLAPLALAVVVQAGGLSRPVTMEIPARPALAFDQYLVDLGKIQSKTEVRGRFVFENRGAAPVHIDKVDPSCGCLMPRVSSHDLKPGETGVIELRMQPANEMPGRREYYADVTYHDPEPREVRVTFRVEIPEQHLGVKPKALLIYQNTGEATTHDLQVSDSRPNPAKITGVQANSPFVTVEIVNTETSAEFGLVTNFRVTVSAELPTGRREALITIETDDPQSPVLKVPMLLQGRNRDE